MPKTNQPPIHALTSLEMLQQVTGHNGLKQECQPACENKWLQIVENKQSNLTSDVIIWAVHKNYAWNT
jgi:hypothetical protein